LLSKTLAVLFNKDEISTKKIAVPP